MNLKEDTLLRDERERLQDTVEDIQSAIPIPVKKKSRFDPRRMMVVTFLVLITVGTFLLSTPWAQASGTWAWFNQLIERLSILYRPKIDIAKIIDIRKRH